MSTADLNLKERVRAALVKVDWVDESLLLFRKVFAMDKNWAILTPRLPKSGLLPDDPKLIERILSVAK